MNYYMHDSGVRNSWATFAVYILIDWQRLCSFALRTSRFLTYSVMSRRYTTVACYCANYNCFTLIDENALLPSFFFMCLYIVHFSFLDLSIGSTFYFLMILARLIESGTSMSLPSSVEFIIVSGLLASSDAACKTSMSISVNIDYFSPALSSIGAAPLFGIFDKMLAADLFE